MRTTSELQVLATTVVHQNADTCTTLPWQQTNRWLASLLRSCAKCKDLQGGISLHATAVKRALHESSSYLANTLVFMYVKCGALPKAQQLLVGLPIHDALSWTQVIAGLAQQGQGHYALDCFEQMKQNGVSPDAVTFSCVLKACASVGSLEKGKHIHDEISRQGLLGSNLILGTALVDMYAKCGDLVKAQQVLIELPARDAHAWSTLISGYAQQGQGQEALRCFHQMQRENLMPDAVTFLCVLKACSSIKAAAEGKLIHDEISRQGFLTTKPALGTALVDMYAKCGLLDKARAVLDELPARDVILWSALITRYAQQGQGQHALNCFERMCREGIWPNAVTYASVLKACGITGAVEKGKLIHHEIARQGLLKGNVVLGTALVDMYAKCGALSKAQEVLEDLPVGDVISWCALITGYAEWGCGKEAIKCFEQMHQRGLSPDAITFSCILNACKQSGLIKESKCVFADIIPTCGSKPSMDQCTVMVDFLGSTGLLSEAADLIQKVPSACNSTLWSVLLDSCEKSGCLQVGEWAFDNVVFNKTGIKPHTRSRSTC